MLTDKFVHLAINHAELALELEMINVLDVRVVHSFKPVNVLLSAVQASSVMLQPTNVESATMLAHPVLVPLSQRAKDAMMDSYCNKLPALLDVLKVRPLLMVVAKLAPKDAQFVLQQLNAQLVLKENS